MFPQQNAYANAPQKYVMRTLPILLYTKEVSEVDWSSAYTLVKSDLCL
jgi:hypothetical protein